MLYIGLDAHSKWTTGRGFDPETGEIVELDRVSNDRESLQQVFGGLRGPVYGVMESGTNSWAMYRELAPYFAKLVVADPAKLWDRRADRVAKTDAQDALRMAEKLYRGQIDGLYIPDAKTQDLRVLVRSKIRASRWVTRLVNEMGSLLRSWGYVGSRSLLSKSGKSKVDQAELPARSARVLKLWQELLEKAQQIEDELQVAIEEEAAQDADCAILQTIPGVGAFTALLVRAEIGEISRFERSGNLASYMGLTPRVYQSGERCYYGKLGHWGNRWLRYAIGLLAQRMAQSRSNSSLHRVYMRISLKNHRNAAKMTVARKAAKLIFHLLTKREVWRDVEQAQETSAA